MIKGKRYKVKGKGQKAKIIKIDPAFLVPAFVFSPINHYSVLFCLAIFAFFLLIFSSVRLPANECGHIEVNRGAAAGRR